ncbi:MAG: CRISPR-associated endonuclease Cas2 [Deltaproteobacteria bacterium]|nr:CRISPR-associated endonuclease Cas2 [Deltaproteobacteria bacterium]
MSHDKRWRLVCYDIRDPGRYRRASKLIKGAGRRVQYSVFRCRLDDRELERLRWELSRVLDPADGLLVVDLCPSCAARVVTRNRDEDWSGEEEAFTIWPPVDHAPPAGGAPDGPCARNAAAPLGKSAASPEGGT